MVKKIVLLRQSQKDRLQFHREAAFQHILTHQVHDPTWLDRLILPFIQSREIVHPSQKIYTYKRIGRRVFDLTATGYKQIDSIEEYLKIFGDGVRHER